jgi:hypothetical protein
MDDFYTLPEELRAEYEREYNEWLDTLDLDEVIDDAVDSDEFVPYEEDTYQDDEVISYDDLVNDDRYLELDFND